MTTAALPLPRPHKTGVLLVLTSTLFFALSGVFTNGLSSPTLTVIFWRNLSVVIFCLLYLIWRRRLRSEWAAFGWSGLIATILIVLGMGSIIPAYRLSSVANVTLIFATAPIWSAFLTWLWVKEHPNKRIMICSGVAFAGVALIMADSLGTGSIAGDILSLIMTLVMSATFVVYRVRPDTPKILPTVFASICLVLVAVLFTNPLQAPPVELPILALFGLTTMIAAILLWEGAPLIPAPEVALLSALEVPIAPLFAWVLLNETASLRVILGGVVVFGAILYSQSRQSP